MADEQFKKDIAVKEEAPKEEKPVEASIPSVRLVKEYPFDEVLVATPNSADRTKVTKSGVKVKDEAVRAHLLDTPYVEATS